MFAYLITTAALAGSTSGLGVPVAPQVRNEFEPMVHVGIEGGGELLLSGNGGAFDPGPSARISADVQDANVYRAQVSWSWSGHALVDGSALFVDPLPITATDGYVSTHSLMVGAKGLLLAKENESSERRVDPWASTAVGVSIAFGRVAWQGLADPVTSRRAYLVFDGAAGVDLRIVDAVSIGPSIRANLNPGVRTDPDDGTRRFELQLAAQPSLSIGLHI